MNVGHILIVHISLQQSIKEDFSFRAKLRFQETIACIKIISLVKPNYTRDSDRLMVSSPNHYCKSVINKVCLISSFNMKFLHFYS